MKMTSAIIGMAMAIAVSGTGVAHATNLVTNGDFELTTGGSSGQLGYGGFNATGWSVPAPSGSYSFLFTPGTASNGGVNGQYGSLDLWGPGNGSANGLTGSPTGGNFIAQDSAFQQGAISQNISGLTAGNQYTVSFWWAGAQQYGFSGPTFDNWTVSFGSQSQTTATINLPDHGFSPWQKQSFTFTADGTSDLLSFYAAGGPPGVPPFALLDGVSLTAVPEASTWFMMLAGFAGLGLFGYRRREKNRAVA
jgi:hypothetical protein